MAASMFYGWRVVGAAFVLAAFGWGVGFYGPPIYLHAVQAERGWALWIASGAVTLHFLIGAVVVANLPALYRRFGVPAVTQAGAGLLATGVLGWALAGEPWMLVPAAAASGAGWVAMGAAAINAILQPWFAARRPAALAMAYNGASVGGILFQPLWVAGIAAAGFVATAAAVGVVMIVTVALLARTTLARTPAGMGLHADGAAAAPTVAAPASGPAWRLWRDRRFVTLAAAMTLGLFAQIGLIAHLFSLLVPGLGAGAAGLAMAAATAAAIAGRTMVGWLLSPGSDRRGVAAASYGVQMAGGAALLLAGGSEVPLLVLGVLLVGAGIGNATSLPPLIVQAELAPDQVGRAVALMVAVAQAGYAFAPAAFGLLRDPVTVTAPLLFAAAIGLQGAAVLALLAGRPRAAPVSRGRGRACSG